MSCTSGVVSDTTVAPETSITETTSGASDKQVTGSQRGTTGVTLSTSVAPGSSSTGVTTVSPKGNTGSKSTISGATKETVNQGTGSTLEPTKTASGTTLAPGSSNTVTTSSGVSQTTGIGKNTGTTRAVPGSNTSPGNSNTGATTGISETPGSESETGTTEVVSGTTIPSESSNTEATTLGHDKTTEAKVSIVTTTGITTGTTLAPRSSNTRATTSTEVIPTTGVKLETGTTSGSTTVSRRPENSSPGVSTEEPGKQVTGSNTGTPKESSETTTAGITTTAATASTGVEETSSTAVQTGSTSVTAGVTTGPQVSQPETTVVATENQEVENKTGCPGTLPPAPVCHGPLGEEKSPGDTWTSNCHKCTCTDAKTVDCKPQECPSPPVCRTGEKLVTFNDTCCEIGHCEPQTCLFNNTDYEIGTSFDDPSNPCVSYSCNSTGFVAVVQDCPKQSWCAEEDRIYDSRKCCYTCKNNCRTSPVNVTVKYNGCKKRIQMAKCMGECKRTLKYNYDLFQLENSCLCCREDNYEFRDIALDCPDGSTLSYRYRHTTTCSCLDMCEQTKTASAHSMTR
nr:apomucin-like [Marmota flaviventris]